MTTILRYDLSASKGKECAYGAGELNAAAAWDDVAGFCNGTSSIIVAGRALDRIAIDTPPICERGGSTGTGGAVGVGKDSGSEMVPAANCYNRFSSDCEPCCPDPPPDCTGKPYGYPGYSCTPGSGSYCSCQCESGKWQCGC